MTEAEDFGSHPEPQSNYFTIKIPHKINNFPTPPPDPTSPICYFLVRGSNTKMSATEAQIRANRENALKSTGPRTDEGKRVSRMNARRHNLTGQFFCISETDDPAYRTFESSMMADLNAVGAYETQLAISIVQNQWRLNRARAIESNLFGLGHDRRSDSVNAPGPDIHAAALQAETWRTEHPSIGNLALYESRLRRFVTQDRKELKELQSSRIVRDADASQTATNLLKLAEMAHRDVEDLLEDFVVPDVTPTKLEVNGFVYAFPEIRRRATIRHLSEMANNLPNLDKEALRTLKKAA